MGQTLRVWVIACIVPYALLSGAIYGATQSEGLHGVLHRAVRLLWLAGPAANLVIDLRDSLNVYLVGSGIVMGAALGLIHSERKGSSDAMWFLLLGVVVWLFFGALAYLPMF